MDKLYYISQGKNPEEHLKNIQKVCEAGCKLVQLRVKKSPEKTYISIAKEAKKICRNFGAKLIINDNAKVTKAVKADGVHLGKNDMSILEAKKIILNESIIGGTANTLEDCVSLINQGVDYIGLGPLRFTNTKKNLSPMLGINGYKKIISTIKNKGCQLPIYGVGGITTADFKDLYKSGIFGIAVSGLISNRSTVEIKKIIEQSKDRSFLVNH